VARQSRNAELIPAPNDDSRILRACLGDALSCRRAVQLSVDPPADRSGHLCNPCRSEGCPRRPAFFWSVFTNPARGPELLGQVWKDVWKVFIIALVLDVIYELIVYRWVYPGQAVIVATILAIVPYLLIRGPVTRVMRRFPRP
jgi:hypothetical protein